MKLEELLAPCPKCGSKLVTRIAKMYDLDFIEICTEEYDILIDEKAYENEQVQSE